MKIRNLVLCGVAACVALGSAQLVYSQEKEPAAGGAEADAAAEMAKHAAANMPGAEHAQLAKGVGEWDAETSMWMGPGEPTKSKGRLVSRMAHGGRHLVGEFTSDFMGEPFSGTATTGYDTVKKQYWMTWTDSMSTRCDYRIGTADASGKVITFPSSEEMEWGGQKFTWKFVVRLESDDLHVMESYATPVGGGESFKDMEIRYTRKK